MNNKERYAMLCNTENGIPIYIKPFWLNAVCGEENWDILLHENESEIIAALPFYIKKRYGFSYITQPKFCQTMGVWIKYPEGQSHYKRLSLEKDVMSAFTKQLEQLPIYFYQQCFHHSITNWLPFYWQGYQQTTKYTYRIENISDPDVVFANFSHAKRKNVKHALSENLAISYNLTAKEFYSNHVMTLNKQGQTISYSYDLFERMYKAAYENNAGCTVCAKDNEGNLHAALFVIWDKNTAYDLISTIDPDFRNSGAATLLIFEMIHFLSDKVKSFDFEGSMIEGVENSFRQFGALQTPYFFISKIYTKNPFIRYFIKKKVGENA